MTGKEPDALIAADLPEPLRSYAEIIGLENLKKLARQKGGRNLYIPTGECLDKYSFPRRVCSEYNGSNMKELERKYGISKSTIYHYLKNGREK